MDIFSALGKLFNIVLDAARAPAEQHAQIVADGLAREKEAVQAVLDYYSHTRAKLDDVDRYISEAEHKAEIAAHEQTRLKLADLQQRHDILRSAIDLAKPVTP